MTTVTKTAPVAPAERYEAASAAARALLDKAWDEVQAGVRIDIAGKEAGEKKRQIVQDLLSETGDATVAVGLLATSLLDHKTAFVRALGAADEAEFKARRTQLDAQIEYFRRLAAELAGKTWTSTRPKRGHVVDGRAGYGLAHGVEVSKPKTRATASKAVETDAAEAPAAGSLDIKNLRACLNALIGEHGCEAIMYGLLRSVGMSEKESDALSTPLCDRKVLAKLFKAATAAKPASASKVA